MEEDLQKNMTTKGCIGLGHPPGPPHQQPHLLSKKDSPARQRRRARRAEARQLAADEAAVKATKTKESSKAMEEIQVIDTEKVTEGKAFVETAGNIPFSDVSDEFCRNTDYLGDENSPETMNEIKFSFNSEYAEQDIHKALEEIFPDKTAVKSTKLLSRVRIEQRSAVHDCIVVLEVADPDTFVWPKLKGEDVDVFKEIKRIKK